MKKNTTHQSLLDYQTYIKDMCQQKSWDERTVIEKMLFLTEEVGELAPAIINEQGIFGYKKPNTIQPIAEELVDVFNYVLDIANVYNINLEKAFEQKKFINKLRTWHKGYGQTK